MPNKELYDEFRSLVNTAIKEFGRYLEAVENAISEDSEEGALVTTRERDRIEKREKIFEQIFMDLINKAKEFK